MGLSNFLKERKAWVIGPIVLFVVALALIVIGARGSALAHHSLGHINSTFRGCGHFAGLDHALDLIGQCV